MSKELALPSSVSSLAGLIPSMLPGDLLISTRRLEGKGRDRKGQRRVRSWSQKKQPGFTYVMCVWRCESMTSQQKASGG